MSNNFVFNNFVILENCFCISRPYFIKDRKTRVLCDSIVLIVASIIIATIAIDIISSDVGNGFRIFQALTGWELICLALLARYQDVTSLKLERLDEKCRTNEDNFAELNVKSNRLIILTIASFIFDMIGLKMLNVKNTVAIFLGIVFAAHDAEFAYFSLLVERINARFKVLKYVHPNSGSRGYAYLLFYISNLSEQSSLRLLLLLGTALVTTVIYQFLLIVADAEIRFHLSLYLLWRESRALYSLWMMCSAVAQTNDIRKELGLHLVGHLTAERNNINRNQSQYKLVQRWYSVVVSIQPHFISGTLLHIGLSTPILVIDLSINYMLIIVQMYMAYK